VDAYLPPTGLDGIDGSTNHEELCKLGTTMAATEYICENGPGISGRTNSTAGMRPEVGKAGINSGSSSRKDWWRGGGGRRAAAGEGAGLPLLRPAPFTALLPLP
jgi:hypothetical protein